MKWLQVLVLMSLVLMSFSLWPAYGHDEEWTFYFTNLTGDRFYYNPQSIVYGQRNTVKVLQRLSSGQAGSDLRGGGTIVELDCSKLMYRRLKTETVSRTGETRNVSEPSQWNSIPQGSPTEILSHELCVKTKLHGRGDR